MSNYAVALTWKSTFRKSDEDDLHGKSDDDGLLQEPHRLLPPRGDGRTGREEIRLPPLQQEVGR